MQRELPRSGAKKGKRAPTAVRVFPTAPNYVPRALAWSIVEPMMVEQGYSQGQLAELSGIHVRIIGRLAAKSDQMMLAIKVDELDALLDVLDARHLWHTEPLVDYYLVAGTDVQLDPEAPHVTRQRQKAARTREARLRREILVRVTDAPGAGGRERTAKYVRTLIGNSRLQLQDVLAAIDAMLEQGQLTTTPGPRPVLVATATGHDELRALRYPSRRVAS